MLARPLTPPVRRVLVAALLVAAGCARQSAPANGSAAGEHAGHDMATMGAGGAAPSAAGLPAGANDVQQRLASSPRHGEWVTVGAGTPDSVRAWVVYPERRDRAPVVVVIHEIFGLSSWVRGVADQLAADGYIAIAPDLLTGKFGGNADTVGMDTARQLVSQLNAATVQRQVAAVGRYGMQLPAAQPRWGVVGFCWGGSTSFATAVQSPEGLRAAVVYYGTSPASAQLASVRVPVLGLYGADDARVVATVAPADSAMRALGKSYTYRLFEGAGHGFLRQQDGRDGANLRATQQAWPLTVSFFRTHLGA